MKNSILVISAILLAHGECVLAKTASAKTAVVQTAAAISDLVARQDITAQNNNVFHASDAVSVEYSLPRAAPVTISIYQERAFGLAARWYAHPANLVGKFGTQGKAGAQKYSVKLGDLKISPVMPPYPPGNTDEKRQPLPLFPGRFVIEVQSGDGANAQSAHVSLQIVAANSPVASSKSIPFWLLGTARDSKGNILAADRRAWIGRRFSPDWKFESSYPNAGLGASSNPAETWDVAVDSKDNYYAVTYGGIYKFGPDGNAAPWTDNSDYLKYPYPSEIKNTLGLRLQSDGGKRQYVFGPGGGGAGAKDYSPEDAKNPGFAFGFGGAAIDANDNVYLASNQGQYGGWRVQVFESSGKFLRYLAMPTGIDGINAMRFGKDGILWASTNLGLLGLDAQSGAVEKKIQGGRGLHIAADGTIYTYDGARLWRYDASGEPLLFTAKSSAVQDAGKMFNLRPQDNNVPAEAGGFTDWINSIATRGDGSFDVLTSYNPNDLSHDDSVLHFTREGAFVPDTLDVKVMNDEPNNIFVGVQPAQLAAQVSNIRGEAATLKFTTTTRDLDNKIIGSSQVVSTLPSHATTSTIIPLNAKAMGYYSIEVEARDGDKVILSQQLYGGRVAPRGNEFQPYSPFGSVRMENSPETIRRMGGALDRNHFPMYWSDVEPKLGEWNFYPADTLNFFKAHAMSQMVILGYGEPWLNGSFPNCRIYDYDNFFDYVAAGVNHYKGTAGMWQIWNEPNFFWHVPGPYQYEHYAQVQQMAYSICKAIDPETPVIGDGFAGSASEMGKLAEQGTAGFADGVPIHYPGATVMAWDKMPLPDTIESKVGMVRELAQIRDKYFPSRQLMNTEEGLWGKGERTMRDGAELLPRMYVSQIASGMDRLTWFECFSATDPTYLLRGVNDGPWPAYFAYATASRFLENAQYVGAISDGLSQVHLFAVAGKPVVVAWSIKGERDYDLQNVGSGKLSLTDWQGNASTLSPNGGSLKLHLGATVQYISGADAKLFAPFVQKIVSAAAPLQVAPQPKANDLNTLFHDARQGEILAIKFPNNGEADVSAANAELARATSTLKAREADGAYLRDSHAALEIDNRSAYFMNFAQSQGNATYAKNLAPLVVNLSKQVETRAASEAKWYPGVMLRVALDTSKIRASTPADQPLDEKFDPQVSKNAGQQVELEITVYNWTKTDLKGSVSPTLPDGWKADKTAFEYSVAPMKFARFSTLVSIPANAAKGVYNLGAQSDHNGSMQHEIHAHRVSIQ